MKSPIACEDKNAVGDFSLSFVRSAYLRPDLTTDPLLPVLSLVRGSLVRVSLLVLEEVWLSVRVPLPVRFVVVG